MFTSDRISRDTGSADKETALIYLIISIVIGIAGAVYEHFSFGVYSHYMIYAFAVPLIGGTLPYLVKSIRGGRSSEKAGLVWGAAIATLTVGSILMGALEICGRPNSLVAVYPAVGLALMILSQALRLLNNAKNHDGY